MNKFIKQLIVLSVMFLGVSSYIYACPGGMINAGACLPPDDPRLPQNQRPAPPPAPIWADRWGAIANDRKGVFGIVSNLPSKRKAEKAAINECHKRGGGACVIDFTYHNQCVALGSNEDVTNTASGPDIDEVKIRAVRDCESRSNKKCIVFYSGCSTAVRVN